MLERLYARDLEPKTLREKIIHIIVSLRAKNANIF